MEEIDIRVLSAFAVYPRWFQEYRNANYEFFNGPEDSYRKRFSRIRKLFLRKFKFMSSEEPDCFTLIEEMWDAKDREGPWP